MFRLKKNPRADLCPVWACRRRHGKKNVLCAVHSQRRWRAQNPVRAAYNRLKSHAKQRGIEFNLSYPDWTEFVALTNYTDNSGRTRNCFHVDRISPWRGYERDNIQVLTCSENIKKQNRELCPF